MSPHGGQFSLPCVRGVTYVCGRSMGEAALGEK